MKSVRILLFVAVLLCVHAQPGSLPALSEPSLAPDRSEVAFVSGGDIWTVPLAGGEARLLVSHPATESRPLYSPDGKSLAFVSTRTGNGDVYVLNLGSGDLKRITYSDSADRLEAWSRDGQWLYFSNNRGDIGGMTDIYRVHATGGTAMPVSSDRYVAEYFAAPSPGGDVLAFNGKGIAGSQWWRHGHSHIDESEIWLRHEGSPAKYERLTPGGAKEIWPMWSADGKRIYFVSDRSGAENIWTKTLGGAAKQVTQFTKGRVLWPSIAYDGKNIVFERDFTIWKLDVQNGKTSQIPISLRGAPASPEIAHTALTQGFRSLALSRDGKKIAFVAHGDVFAASAKDGGNAARITQTPGNEFGLQWSADNRRLVYTSDRTGAYNLFTYDLATNTETQITNDPAGDAAAQWSPDGKLIAFIRGGKDLRVYDLERKTVRTLASGSFGKPPFQSDREFCWSPDNAWIAYVTTGDHHFSNVYVVPVEGGAPRPVSFLPNTFSNSIAWSPDGTFLLFQTGQRTENGAIARIDLIPRVPKFREDLFRDLFRQEENPKNKVTPVDQPAPAQPQSGGATEPKATATPVTVVDQRKAVRIVFDDIRRRVSFLPTGLDAGYATISPDGKTVMMIAEAADQQNLYSFSIDELGKEPPVARQLTTTSAPKRDPQFTPDGKELYYLEAGQVHIVNMESRTARPLVLTAETDIDFAQEKREVFNQAWTYMRDNFVDPEFHGVNWRDAKVAYEPYVLGARTPDELRRVISLMIGELNASHLGIVAPASATVTTTGNLGLRFDGAEYEKSGHLQIAGIIPLSPASLSGELNPGYFLLAVDGHSVDAPVNLDQLLENKIEKRVVLTIATSPDGAGKRDIAVRPVNTATEKNLIYREWVESRRAYVSRISNGKLGYVHMLDMGSPSLERLFLDLDVENQSRDGVVIDVRNNNGGFVNAYALDVLARKGYLVMTDRDLPPAPARSMLGQRSLEKPTILVTNQHSLSDAEDFSEGYRALGLGKVVGEPTAGWIIYTSNVPLIDGSIFRIPGTKITTIDGTNMEMHPRPVDVLVEQPLGETYTGRDAQLERAVGELLKQIGPRSSTPSTQGRQ